MDHLTGFGNYVESEALENALPKGQNSPQVAPYQLYAEQLSGSAFTAPKQNNLRSWLYRILPSVKRNGFVHATDHLYRAFQAEHFTPPNQLRWHPYPLPQSEKNFLESLFLYAHNGDVKMQTGGAIYMYACNQSMNENFLSNSDGDLLIVPQQGKLLIKTELGDLSVGPADIALIPRGITFQVELEDEQVRGYVCENFGHHFVLPERGPIGANGLANQRDFKIPNAKFYDESGEFKIFCKFQHHLYETNTDTHPLNVVAWHGNYYPYQYNLNDFNVMNSVNYDHADPSIFTVLTSPSEIPGTANIDFVIFPERWLVTEHTFRPPYYHKNIMSEFMGLIYGTYDAKEDAFAPGGASIHNCMSPHGPDEKAFSKASHETLTPNYYQGTLAFMFESRLVWQVSDAALVAPHLDLDYLNCWQSLQKLFNGNK